MEQSVIKPGEGDRGSQGGITCGTSRVRIGETVADAVDDDDLLMRAACTGDQAAFGKLMARHRPWVTRLINAVVSDHDQAQDLTQEVFCRVYQHRNDYRPGGKFIPWLKTLALNQARNFLRDHRQQRQRTLAWEEISGHGPSEPASTEYSRRCLDPQAVLTSRLLQHEVLTALSALSTEQQHAVALHYFGGKGVEEIARALNCPAGTVKSRLFHARRHLRQALLLAWGSAADTSAVRIGRSGDRPDTDTTTTKERKVSR